MSRVTWYCGEQGLVKVSINDGVSWDNRSISPGSQVTLYDIMAWPSLPDKATTVGDFSVIIFTTDQGNNWTLSTLINLVGDEQTYKVFEEVWNIDLLNSYVVGYNPSFPLFYKSTDGGLIYTSILIIDGVNTLPLFKTGKARAIHFLTPLIGVIAIIGDINAPYVDPGIANALYVLMTLDGGLTWRVTNDGGIPFMGYPLDDINLINLPWGIKLTETSPLVYTITVVSENGIYRSTNSGNTFSSPEIFPTGVTGLHLTWIDDSKVWYTRYRTSDGRIRQSLDLGANWINMPLLSIPGKPRAAHFYTDGINTIGYYSSENSLYKTLNDGVSPMPLAPVDTAVGITGPKEIWAVWTEQSPLCYTLCDCSGVLANIEMIVSIPSIPIGSVLTFVEYPGTCWTIISQGFCIDSEEITPVLIFEDCKSCLPIPPETPVKRYPYILTKIFNRVTVGPCDIKANQVFAEGIYDQVKKLRYGIETSCVIDMTSAWIKKELSDLESINNSELCAVLPNPCCVEPPVVCIFPVPTLCPPATDPTTIALFN